MNKKIGTRMERIYQAIGEPIQIETEELYKISLNNSPAAEDLRALLLQVHIDQRLVELFEDGGVSSRLYDPFPTQDAGWVLDWKKNGREIQFGYNYLDDDKPKYCQYFDFELYKDRFYAQGRELVDLFPNLTADILENAILKHIQEKRVREKNELLLREKRRRGIYY